jgi:general secretion pathway protein I
MIALLIVSVSIVAVAGINASSMSMHVYSKQLTVATLLARGKMADIEQALQADGLPTDDETEDGDFSEEGFPKIKWRAEILRPKTEDIQIANRLQSVGLDGSSEGPLGGFLDSQLLTNSEFFAGSSAGSGITTDIGSLLSAGGGLVSGMLTSQLQTMVDNLGNTVREVRLTVSWGEEKKGSARDSFSIATHVVSLGQGTDQRQSDAVAQGLDKAMNSAGTTSGVNVNTSGTSSSSTSGSHSSSSSSSGGNR